MNPPRYNAYTPPILPAPVAAHPMKFTPINSQYTGPVNDIHLRLSRMIQNQEAEFKTNIDLLRTMRTNVANTSRELIQGLHAHFDSERSDRKRFQIQISDSVAQMPMDLVRQFEISVPQVCATLFVKLESTFERFLSGLHQEQDTMKEHLSQFQTQISDSGGQIPMELVRQFEISIAQVFEPMFERFRSGLHQGRQGVVEEQQNTIKEQQSTIQEQQSTIKELVSQLQKPLEEKSASASGQTRHRVCRRAINETVPPTADSRRERSATRASTIPRVSIRTRQLKSVQRQHRRSARLAKLKSS